MSSCSPAKYKTRNWLSYNTALKQRGSLSIWFDPEMQWHALSTGKRGRQPEFSDAAIQICLTMKVLFDMPLRQTIGFVASLLRLAGLDWNVPDFSTLCRRQKSLSVAIPYRGGTGPLHLLIDATGVEAEGEGEWNARKHGRPKKRLWRELHLAMFTLLRMKKLWRSGQLASRQAMLATLRCCLTCWIRSRPTRRLPRSPPPLGSILRMHLPGSGRGI